MKKTEKPKKIQENCGRQLKLRVGVLLSCKILEIPIFDNQKWLKEGEI